MPGTWLVNELVKWFPKPIAQWKLGGRTAEKFRIRAIETVDSSVNQWKVGVDEERFRRRNWDPVRIPIVSPQRLRRRSHEMLPVLFGIPPR